MAKRWDILTDYIKKYNLLTGAEIGVWKGVMAEKVLNMCPEIKKYYCVDLWDFYNDYWESLNPDGNNVKQNMKDIYKIFINKTSKFKNKIEILKQNSKEAAEAIKNESLDFCFIDANHAYEYVKNDILYWLPKIKNGGLIGGHDYGRKEWGNGVKQAVDEIFGYKNIILRDDNTWWKWNI